MNKNNADKVIVFAGTYEGRILCEYLAGHHITVTACVATEYGSMCLSGIPGLTIKEGRLSEHEIGEIIADYDYIMDATHPYACVITENIKEAAGKQNKAYIRILRPVSGYDNIIECENIGKACEYLNQVDGNVLVTTGSKELLPYTEIVNYESRLYVRVLPSQQSLEECLRHGFKPSNIICMQGPFSEELNIAMLKHTDARYLVTKETGRSGGFDEKLSAAAKCNVKVIVIGRPSKEEGLSVKDACYYLKKELRIINPC